MKKALTLLILSVLMAFTASAQRKTDPLDRGVVAVKTSSGVFVSWRIQADEYYDVKYNIYRNGTKLNSTPLNVSNYTDNSGTASSTYTVKAVKNGVEGSASKAASVWTSVDGNNNTFLSIQMQDVVDRNGNVVFCSCGSHSPGSSVAQNYTLNDCSVADLDGDGEMEIIVKRINASDANSADPYAFNNEIYSTTNNRAYVLLEAYKLNGTRLWWIDCGPNMVSLNSTEINIVAYDWDEDGKAEVILRGADNMIIHKSDGSVYNVGDMTKNYRYDTSHTDAQYAWTKIGNEYLLYLNGATANPYSVTEFPLKRLETGETLASAWAEGNTKQAYGHRSSKYFFGAPVLDGRKASIFLARGIYTQTKMCALDVNPSTHALTTRWTWKCNTKGSAWYGQGNHNMNIADVDGDGCDEIIYGSMVIDNNGKGLSTTGLGHGDALHTGDLDPFRKGLETFACNEDSPSSNFRNAATCEVYFREGPHYDDNGKLVDDGRCMAGNFSNDYPGGIGASTQTGIIALSATTPTAISGWDNNWTTNTPNPALNFRIYWDGDLLEESVNGPGSSEGDLFVGKNGQRLILTSGAKCNNDTKKNPCFSGDVIGDWREELIMRSADDKSLRIYTTPIATSNRVPCLWYDPEYRQAMVWQMCAYNQPPHVSYFMGEMEGLTKVPVPLTMTGRTEITSDGGVVPTSANGTDVIAYNKNVGVPSAGAAPSQLIIDVPSTVSGNDNNNNITYSYASKELGSSSNNGDLTGNMHLIKQGDGLLKITARDYSYTGNTDVYAGSVYFCGTLNSPVWMNRHTTLYTSGTYHRAVTMEYGSTLYITKDNSKSDGSAPTIEYATATVDTLNLHEGSRVVFDIDKASAQSDVLNLKKLSIRKRDWQYGPEYLAPVFKFNSTSALQKGNYKIGTIGSVDGLLSDAIIEGTFASGTKQRLSSQSGNLYLKVYDENEDDPILPQSSVAMTYVDYSNPSTSYGIVTPTIAGYNTISGGNIGFGNTGWGANYITYVKLDLSEYKEHNVKSVEFSFKGSGSTDGKRSTGWGIGYNSSEWTSDMTYDTADKSITTIGAVQYGTTKSSAVYESFTWDITDVYNADEDGIITILIYETAAAGGYVKEPAVEVDYEYVEKEEEPTNVIAGTTTTILNQDFEDASTITSGWTSSVSDRFFSTQTSLSDDTHYAKFDAGSTNGAVFTYSSLVNAGTAYTSLSSYTLEFDFAIIPTNGASSSAAQTPTFTIYDKNGNSLCHWQVTTAAKTAAANSTGQFYLGTTETGTFTANLTPFFYHVKITGNSDGTIMTVSDQFDESEQYTLSNNLIYIGRWIYSTGKQYGGLCLDNIKLYSSVPSSLTLSPTASDDYESGIYQSVTLNRTFKSGYSTLCVPFNTTVAEFTGGDAEAFAAYFSKVEEIDGICTLGFTNTKNIEANQPYIIYLSEALEAPSFKDKPVFAENAKTVTVGDWSMTGNYTPNKSMEGLYGVANNAEIRKGGSSSYINGFTAYLTGSTANARIRFSNGDETAVQNVNAGDPTITAIYTVGGTRVATLQKGVNLVRMSDNTVRKVFVK